MEGLLSAARGALLPSLCPHCGEALGGRERGLCGMCWARVVPMAGATCSRCGSPAEDAQEGCMQCRRNPPPHLAMVVWGEHDGVLRTIILALKHGQRDELAGPIGERLAALVASQPWADSIDCVCGVPSHPLRRIRRPWSAASLIAAAVARALGRPAHDPLRRHGVRRQTGRSRAARLALPARTFSANVSVRGTRPLLVDDVTTTGTTLARASQALLRAGADAVFCAAVARTPDPRRI